MKPFRIKEHIRSSRFSASGKSLCLCKLKVVICHPRRVQQSEYNGMSCSPPTSSRGNFMIIPLPASLFLYMFRKQMEWMNECKVQTALLFPWDVFVHFRFYVGLGCHSRHTCYYGCMMAVMMVYVVDAPHNKHM